MAAVPSPLWEGQTGDGEDGGADSPLRRARAPAAPGWVLSGGSELILAPPTEPAAWSPAEALLGDICNSAVRASGLVRENYSNLDNYRPGRLLMAACSRRGRGGRCWRPRPLLHGGQGWGG